MSIAFVSALIPEPHFQIHGGSKTIESDNYTANQNSDLSYSQATLAPTIRLALSTLTSASGQSENSKLDTSSFWTIFPNQTASPERERLFKDKKMTKKACALRPQIGVVSTRVSAVTI